MEQPYITVAVYMHSHNINVLDNLSSSAFQVSATFSFYNRKSQIKQIIYFLSFLISWSAKTISMFTANIN